MNALLDRAEELAQHYRDRNLPVEAAVVQFLAENPDVPAATHSQVAYAFKIDVSAFAWINLATAQFRAKRAAEIAELEEFKLTPGQKKEKAIAEGANDSHDALERNRAKGFKRFGAFEPQPHTGSGAAGRPPEPPGPIPGAPGTFATFRGSDALRHRGKPWEHAPGYLRDHCETLGVPWPTTREAAQKLYRVKAMSAHPDRNGGNDEQFKVIQNAWERLDDFFTKANS